MVFKRKKQVAALRRELRKRESTEVQETQRETERRENMEERESTNNELESQLVITPGGLSLFS